MFITSEELDSNLDKYLLMASAQDVFITRNGKTIAKLTSPYKDKIDAIESLYGSIPADITLEEAREERLNKI
ncbi:MAG: type II toxin-antitoxin system prevent-host-death family antitoxin [Clostridia bacterium]|nr:type II toxin-antitoxin system prevent-host-death family antitoxin [Clostridia bacterium]